MKRLCLLVLIFSLLQFSAFSIDKKSRGFADAAIVFGFNNTKDSASDINQSASAFSIIFGGGYFLSETSSFSADIEIASASNETGFAFTPSLALYCPINDYLSFKPQLNMSLGDLGGVFFIYPNLSFFSFESYFNNNLAISFSGPTVGFKYLTVDSNSITQFSVNLSVSQFSFKYIF